VGDLKKRYVGIAVDVGDGVLSYTAEYYPEQEDPYGENNPVTSTPEHIVCDCATRERAQKNTRAHVNEMMKKYR